MRLFGLAGLLAVVEPDSAMRRNRRKFLPPTATRIEASEEQ
jgi:hypothetical protein